MMKGEFGFHRGGGEHETGSAAYVQIYVKSSALSRAPDLAISAHLMTEAEIDEFMDDALAELDRCKEGASRGSFAPSCFLKVHLSLLWLFSWLWHATLEWVTW
jgi:hypothetical protein